MSRFSDYLLDLFYPRRCVYCDRMLDDDPRRVCGQCQQPWISADTPLRTGENFSSCACAGWYEGNLRDAILRFKFQHEASYGAVLAHPLAQCIARNFTDSYDIIAWLPVSKKRLAERGYDQSFLLAKHAADLLQKPLIPMLEKRHTKAQSSLGTAAARQTNVSGVFSLLTPERVQGARLLLVDDLITTGHTLESASACLRDGGAKSVVCACLARTPQDSPRYDDSTA